MDIKEAVEIAKEMKRVLDDSEALTPFGVRNRNALQTLIDYCSEPKVELEKNALTKFLKYGLKSKGFAFPNSHDNDYEEELSKLICTHFKLSVPSECPHCKKEI
jgi:hypothetical protein